MRNRTVLFSMCLMFACVSAFSQENQSRSDYHFPGEHRYQKAKIYLNDFENTVYTVKNLNIRNDHLTYEFGKKTNALQTANELDLSDVYSIKLPAGSFWYVGALTGLGIGVYASVDTHLKEKQKESDDPNYESKASAALYIGVTAGCAIVCGIIGHATKKWKTLYLNEDVSISEGVKLKYNIGFHPVQQCGLLTVNLTF